MGAYTASAFPALQQQSYHALRDRTGRTSPGRLWHFGLIEHQGCLRRLYAFVMTLGWPRAMYVEFTVSPDEA